MIFEGRVCGLSLIFPLSLLIPQSLLQRKKPSRAVREQGRQSGRMREAELPAPIKKQERGMREWNLWAKRKKKQQKIRNKVILLAWLYLQRKQWTVDSPPLSQLLLQPWLNNSPDWIWPGDAAAVRQIVSQSSRRQTAYLSCLSVQLLAASINPAPPTHTHTKRVTDREVVSDHVCQSNFKVITAWKKCQSVKERTVWSRGVPLALC